MVGLFFYRKAKCLEDHSGRKIQGKRNRTGSEVQILAPNPISAVSNYGTLSESRPPLQASVSSPLKQRDEPPPTCGAFTATGDHTCRAWHTIGSQEVVTIMILSTAFVALHRLVASFCPIPQSPDMP